MVQPEGHPGDTDCHEGGDVDGEDVVGELKYCVKIFSKNVLFYFAIYAFTGK